ncbi:MAG: hypothetical protein E6I09_13180 [Chloroflexi bacterium]|nr:MAG: hypothetical protein E6I09_13180 [Chloroflexota bacterium]
MPDGMVRLVGKHQPRLSHKDRLFFVESGGRAGDVRDRRDVVPVDTVPDSEGERGGNDAD